MNVRKALFAALFALAVALASLQPTYAAGPISGRDSNSSWGSAPAPGTDGGAQWG